MDAVAQEGAPVLRLHQVLQPAKPTLSKDSYSHSLLSHWVTAGGWLLRAGTEKPCSSDWLHKTGRLGALTGPARKAGPPGARARPSGQCAG